VAVDDIVYWADLIDNGYDIQNPQGITFAVTENDTDADGHALTIVSVTQGVNGSVETVPGFDGCPPPCGRVTYNPDGSFPPFDTFTYTISDGYGGTATGTVTVTNVPPVNNVPVAIDDATSVAKGETAVITVTSNDTDADGDTLTIGSVTQPTNGTAESTQGGVIYVHDGSNTTTDTFTYTVADGNGGTAAGTVTVTISENNNPLAVDDAWSVRNGWRAAYSVRDNDIDLDGDPLTVVETSGAGSGRSTIAHSGNFGMVGDQPGTGVSYTHDGSDTTTDTFTYTVSDGNGGTATASVTVTIVAANRRPAIVDETVIVANGERVEIDILSNDSDADGDTLRVRSVTQGANGEVEPSTGADAWLPSSENGTKLAYTHDGSATTSDTFTYTVSDGFGGTATGTVTITIESAVNNVPVAVDDVGDVANGGTVEIDVTSNDSDADGHTLTVDSVDQGTNGTASITSGGVTYTHDGSATTSDTFTYTVRDSNGGTATGTVTVTIAAAAVNDVPVAVDDAGDVANGGTVEIDVTSNDSDADGDSFTIEVVTQGANGTVETTSGGLTYTHDGSATTSDSFTYTVSDGNGGTATGTVTVTIAAAAVNNVPVAVDDAFTLAQGGNGAYDEVINNDTDADGDALTVTAVTQGTYGTVDNLGWGVRYTHDGLATTSDTFTYTVSDGNGGTDIGTVTITIAE
jgi:hypothetical protein